jgi:putative transposase
MYLWRAVDGEGEVLELLVQSRRDQAAASRLLRKLLRRQGFMPTAIVTDKLRSYGVEFSARLLARKPCSCNRDKPILRSAAASTTRRKAQGFKSAKSAQRFASAHAVVYNVFSAQRHLISRSTHRQFRAMAHTSWRDATAAA